LYSYFCANYKDLDILMELELSYDSFNTYQIKKGHIPDGTQLITYKIAKLRNIRKRLVQMIERFLSLHEKQILFIIKYKLIEN
jgi:hypothetical protein